MALIVHGRVSEGVYIFLKIFICRHHVIESQPMARLLATVCVLHVLASAAHAGVLGPGLELWRDNSGSDGGGCSGCRLDKMGETAYYTENLPLCTVF